MMMSSIPEATASSTAYWINGLSTRGSISLGEALVAGRKRVPRPAAGMMAFLLVAGPCDLPNAMSSYFDDSGVIRYIPLADCQTSGSVTMRIGQRVRAEGPR